MESESSRTILRGILKTSSRTKVQMGFLKMAFENISFFKEMSGKLSREEYMGLVQGMDYEKVQKGKVVFNYGKKDIEKL